MIGNLTGGSDSISRDIGTVNYRMKMLGFNAIRLPFTFAGLAEVRACHQAASTFHCYAFAGLTSVFSKHYYGMWCQDHVACHI